MIDPFTLYAAVSAINGVVSLANGELTRNHQKELNKENRIIRKEDITYQTWLKYSIDRFGFSFNQGGFLEAVAPNAKSPIIIFDTALQHYTTNEKNYFPINPLIELESSFVKQNNKHLNNHCTVVGFSAGFKSQAEVFSFYNRELKDKSAVLVYADFDGTKLRIKAVYGGITLNQFMVNEQGSLAVIPSNPYSIELCEIRYDLLLQELLPKNGDSKLSNVELIKGKIQIQKAIEFASITSLQSLLDCYFTLFEDGYKPKTGVISKGFKNAFKERDFTIDQLLSEIDFDKTLKVHYKFLDSQKVASKKLISPKSNLKKSKGFKMLNATEIKQEFDEQLNKILTLKKRPTVLVFGQVGVGKTTLIQKTLGKGIVPPEAISSYKPGTMDFIEYQDNYITLIDSQGFEPGMQVSDFTRNIKSKIQSLQTDHDIKKHIHLAWYCIQGSGGRITKTDLALIKDILSDSRTMVVITKKDITKTEQLEGMINYLVECGIPQERIVAVSELDSDRKGIKRLVEKSIEILPDAYKGAFISKQQVHLGYKKERAREIILQSAKIAGRWGLVPYVDWVKIIPKQVSMAAKLATNYGFNEREINKWLFGAGFLTTIAGSVGANFLFDLLNPFVGAIAGSLNAKATTGALGVFINEYFIEISETIIQGGNLEVIEPLKITKDKLLKAGTVFLESGI